MPGHGRRSGESETGAHVGEPDGQRSPCIRVDVPLFAIREPGAQSLVDARCRQRCFHLTKEKSGNRNLRSKYLERMRNRGRGWQ